MVGKYQVQSVEWEEVEDADSSDTQSEDEKKKAKVSPPAKKKRVPSVDESPAVVAASQSFPSTFPWSSSSSSSTSCPTIVSCKYAKPEQSEQSES